MADGGRQGRGRNRIDGNRANIDHAIKTTWQACVAGEFDFAEAARREQQLRDQYPPPQPAAVPLIATAPKPQRPRRRPDLFERRRHARKLAFSAPLPPRLA